MCCLWPSDNFCSYYISSSSLWIRRQTCRNQLEIVRALLFGRNFSSFPFYSLLDHLDLLSTHGVCFFFHFLLFFSFFSKWTDTSSFFIRHLYAWLSFITAEQHQFIFMLCKKKKIERKKNILFRIQINDFAYTPMNMGIVSLGPVKKRTTTNNTNYTQKSKFWICFLSESECFSLWSQLS